MKQQEASNQKKKKKKFQHNLSPTPNSTISYQKQNSSNISQTPLEKTNRNYPNSTPSKYNLQKQF